MRVSPREQAGGGAWGGGCIGVVVKGYPRLSETFIAQELEALEGQGLPVRILSLRRPTDPRRHPVHRRVLADVVYLPEFLLTEPRRVAAAWRAVRRWPTFGSAWRVWWRDFRRAPSLERARRFGQAVVLAAEAPGELAHLHAHFLHAPASVARYASVLLDLGWTVSAHAKDIWTTPEWEIREKLASARWAVTCTRANLRRLRSLAPAPARVSLAYHGLDLRAFGPPPARPPRPGPLRILSVGRAVVKKGYPVLLEALARLPPDLDWRFVHIGDGPLRAALERQARRLGIADRVQWRGGATQPAVLAAYREADLFALACVVGPDGDRDGLPNVLLEAGSQGIACVATGVGGIAELIRHGETGWLAAPGDAAGLAAGLERLLRDPELRARLGAAAERRVRREFDRARHVRALAAGLGAALEEHAVRVPGPGAAGPVVRLDAGAQSGLP